MLLRIAEQTAQVLIEGLAPYCHRLEVAGSVRRRRPCVGDLELVAIPRWGPSSGAGLLFGDANLLYVRLLELFKGGKLAAIKPNTKKLKPWQIDPNGRYWRLYVREVGLKVDLFLAEPDNWGWIYTIRTGSAGFSRGLLTRWKESTGGAVGSKDGRLVDARGNAVATPEERDVFDLVGLKWMEPARRTQEAGERLARARVAA